MKIQLPNDARAVGYVSVGPYEYAQQFYSAAHGFTGTEREFVAAGVGYVYVDVGPHTRRTVDTVRV